MYCKAKKKFQSDPKFFKIFIFQNLLQKNVLKGRILIYADSGPPRYVLWCCVCICYQPLTFIQIGSGHTVLHHHLSWQIYDFSKFILLLLTLMTLMCKRMMMSKLSKEKSCRPFGIWLAIRLWSESYLLRTYVYILCSRIG